MIHWYEHLYMDDDVMASPQHYKKRIEEDRIHVPPLYCVAIASNPANLFDIISSNELLFQHYKRNGIYVVGLAASYSGAKSIVVNLVQEIFKNTGGFNVRQYFLF